MNIGDELRYVSEVLESNTCGVEDGYMTEDDWCWLNIGLDLLIYRLKEIQEEVRKHYN